MKAVPTPERGDPVGLRPVVLGTVATAVILAVGGIGAVMAA